MTCTKGISQNDTTLVSVLKSRAWNIQYSYPDSSILLCKQGLQVLHNLPAKQPLPHWKEKAAVRLYYCLSYFCSQTGQIGNCMSYVDTMINISSAIGYEWGKARAYDILGMVYILTSDYPKALDYLFKCLKFYEKTGDTRSAILMQARIGNVYQYQNNISKARDYFTMAMQKAIAFGDKTIMGSQYTNMGLFYHLIKDYGKAESNLKKALELTREVGNKKETGLVLGNLGSVYMAENKNGTAIAYFKSAIRTAEEVDNKDNVTYFTGQLGQAYAQIGENKKAEICLLQAIAMARELQVANDMQNFENSLSEMYSKTGRNREALEHYKRHVAIRDSLYNAENTEKTVRSEMTYEFDKKQAANKAQHEKEIITLETESRIQRQLGLFFVIVIVLTLATLFFMKRAYDSKKRDNRLITEQKLAIENANRDLKRQHLLNQKIFSVISHDFRGPMLSLELLLKRFTAQNPDMTLNAGMKNVSEQVSNANGILNNLLSWAHTELDMKQVGQAQSDLALVYEEVAREFAEKIRDKNLELVNTIPAQTAMDLPPDILRITLRNLISNAIKFSYRGRDIHIAFDAEHGALTVKDHGQGIDAAKLEGLFGGLVYSSFGTAREEGFGMGLYMVGELLNKYGYRISVESIPDQWTQFSVKKAHEL